MNHSKLYAPSIHAVPDLVVAATRQIVQGMNGNQDKWGIASVWQYGGKKT
jgi:hypothetical protein